MRKRHRCHALDQLSAGECPCLGYKCHDGADDSAGIWSYPTGLKPLPRYVAAPPLVPGRLAPCEKALESRLVLVRPCCRRGWGWGRCSAGAASRAAMWALRVLLRRFGCGKARLQRFGKRLVCRLLKRLSRQQLATASGAGGERSLPWIGLFLAIIYLANTLRPRYKRGVRSKCDVRSVPPLLS